MLPPTPSTLLPSSCNHCIYDGDDDGLNDKEREGKIARKEGGETSKHGLFLGTKPMQKKRKGMGNGRM